MAYAWQRNEFESGVGVTRPAQSSGKFLSCPSTFIHNVVAPSLRLSRYHNIVKMHGQREFGCLHRILNVTKAPEY